jgi:hypothetical protein
MLPTTTQAVDSKDSSAEFRDRLILSAVAVIIVLLAEATLTAGTCAVTQWVLGTLSTNWSSNVYAAVDAMNIVGAALIGVDFLLMLLFVVRALRRGKFHVLTRSIISFFCHWGVREGNAEL